MSAYKLKKFLFDFEKMYLRMQRHIAEDINWAPATGRTPGAVWCDISSIIDQEIVKQLTESVMRPLHPIFWICDYRGGKSLEIHRDNPGNEYKIHSWFTIIMMLEGTFEMSIWADDQREIIDRAVVSPGEFLVLNNSQYYHSGRVLSGNKLSLHAYPIIEEIDSRKSDDKKFDVEMYV